MAIAPVPKLRMAARVAPAALEVDVVVTEPVAALAEVAEVAVELMLVVLVVAAAVKLSGLFPPQFFFSLVKQRA